MQLLNGGATLQDYLHELRFYPRLYGPIMTELTLTENAAKKVSQLVENKPDHGLRLRVVPGGCSGYQYQFALEKPTEGDEVMRENGAMLIIDKESLALVKGSEIDYSNGLTKAGFRVLKNKQLASTCGCGQSVG